MDIGNILTLVLIGAAGGYLSGLLGVGGGIIFVPILSYFLREMNLNDEEFVRYILANSFATMFFASLVSSYKQYRMGSFYPKRILYTAVPAIITSTLISYLITRTNWYNKQIFSIIFLSLLVYTVIQFIRKARSGSTLVQKTALKKYSITGSLTGLVTALSGLGGGIVMIPLFSQYVKIDMRSASSISIGVILLVLIPVLFTYVVSVPEQIISGVQMGYVIFPLVLPMVAGLVFAAPIGVATSHRISNKHLKIIFAGLVLTVIINTIVNIIIK